MIESGVLILISLALYIFYAASRNKKVNQDESRTFKIAGKNALSFLNLLKKDKPQQKLSMYRVENGEIVECTQSLFEQSMYELSIVVPAYNEEKRLPLMLDSTIEWAEKTLKPKIEIIVVDDGSKDGTNQIVLNYAKNQNKKEKNNVEIKLLQMKLNEGKGSAVKHGILYSLGNYILFADADGATDIQDYEKLYSALKGEGLKNKEMMLVCGSRAHLVKSEAVVKRSLLRNLLMHCFHLYLRLTGANLIKDTQCGFKLVSRNVAKLIVPSLHLTRWSFDIELLYIAKITGVQLCEIAVNWREIEGSKVDLVWDSIRVALDVLKMKFFYSTGIWKVSIIAK